MRILSKLFQFTKALLYQQERSRFHRDKKPLSKIKRFGENEVLKRILSSLLDILRKPN